MLLLIWLSVLITDRVLLIEYCIDEGLSHLIHTQPFTMNSENQFYIGHLISLETG